MQSTQVKFKSNVRRQLQLLDKYIFVRTVLTIEMNFSEYFVIEIVLLQSNLIFIAIAQSNKTSWNIQKIKKTMKWFMNFYFIHNIRFFILNLTQIEFSQSATTAIKRYNVMNAKNNHHQRYILKPQRPTSHQANI